MKRRHALRPSRVAGTPDIDATPVMNMFVILIPFLVSMAAFSQFAVQRLALPGNEAASSAQTEEDAPLLVLVSSTQVVARKGNLVVGERTWIGDVPLGTSLAQLLGQARERFPSLDRVTLALEDEIICADVVACFDACRELGFFDVGVAEAVQ